VLGTLLAMIGIVVNRWNVTVSGLYVPLDYPGAVYRPNWAVFQPGEFGIVAGVLGYALLMLTLGFMFLPLFDKEHGAEKH
jgi:Ni/Fe-hydrogenase subunit HybB-like protein